jgi:hypothetical protein
LLTLADMFVFIFAGNARFVEPDDASNATALDWHESDASWFRPSQQYASDGWLPKRNGEHPRCTRFFWHAELPYGWHVQPASGTNGSTRANVNSWSRFLPSKISWRALVDLSCLNRLG